MDSALLQLPPGYIATRKRKKAKRVVVVRPLVLSKKATLTVDIEENNRHKVEYITTAHMIKQAREICEWIAK